MPDQHPTPRPPLDRPDDQVRVEFICDGDSHRRGELVDLARADLGSLPLHAWREVFCWRPGVVPPPR